MVKHLTFSEHFGVDLYRNSDKCLSQNTMLQYKFIATRMSDHFVKCQKKLIVCADIYVRTLFSPYSCMHRTI